MYNWDYDLPKDWKPKTDAEWIWYITRVVNYGTTQKEKLDKHTVKKYFDKLTLDPDTKEYLKFLLYEN